MIRPHLLVLAKHLSTSTVVTFVEMCAVEGWPAEAIAKNVPGYVGFFGIGKSFLLSFFFCLGFQRDDVNLE